MYLLGRRLNTDTFTDNLEMKSQNFSKKNKVVCKPVAKILKEYPSQKFSFIG